MSNTYLNAAYALQMNHSAKSVLLALANRADENGECHPTIRRISEDTCLGRSTIHVHIKKLVEEGYISKTNQYRKDNSLKSNLYKLLISTTDKVKKVVKKTFDKAVTMAKEFTCETEVKPMSSEISDTQKLSLEYYNEHWNEVSDNIYARASELYPRASGDMLVDAIDGHIDYWMRKAKDSDRLKLTQGQLRATFLQREVNFLKFLNGDKKKEKKSETIYGEFL